MLASVVISGAGPAGLLSALLLSKYGGGINVTILEKSLVADPWSSKSFSVNLNPRGLQALETAGPDVLQAVQDAGMERKRIVLETSTGERKAIPKNPSNWAISRPKLVQVLEALVRQKYPHVTIRRGVAVTGVRVVYEAANSSTNENENFPLHVQLEDGTTVGCTQVIAADGKWSPIRESVFDFQNKFRVRTEPSFGIHFMPPANHICPWDSDATSVFRPANSNAKYYIITAPLPDGVFSVSMVCFDEISHENPWLVPADHDTTGADTNNWEADYHDAVCTSESQQQLSSSDDLVRDKVAAMLQEEMPQFCHDLGGTSDSLTSFHVRRRTSWLEPDDPNIVCYSGAHGRVALVGDAGHAMTPSLGEGCNCALESVVKLLGSLDFILLHDDTAALTEDVLTQAFQLYGRQRPAEVLPIQEQSAKANRYVSSHFAAR